MPLRDYQNLPVLPLIGGTFILFAFGSYLVSWYRLRHIKGPLLASFSYLWILYTTTRWQQYHRYGDLFKKYGKLVRIGPNEVITGSADVIRRMSAARSRYERSDYYSSARLVPPRESLINLISNREHDRLKGQMVHGYSGKEVPSLESDIDEIIMKLVQVIRSSYASPHSFTPLDLAEFSRYFTMDVITKIAYGTEFGYLEAQSDVGEFIKGSLKHLEVAVLCSEIPWCSAVFANPLALKLFAPKHTDKAGFGRALGIARDVVAKRFGPKAEDKQDMLGSFVRHGVTQSQCEAEIPFQIIAGSDTTAAAIRTILLSVITSKQAYGKLQHEIDTAIAQNRISTPVTADQGRQLPYLQAVIYEGLRIRPPATLIGMKKTPPEGDTIDGYFVPGGTKVATSLKPAMMDVALFGNDAEVFRPERWLNVEPQKRQLMINTVELVFSTGRWGCLGRPVALLELNKIFIELLRNFDFQVINPRRPVDQEFNMNIWMEEGMWVKVANRQVPDTFM
ncbi:cytochrome P450 [Stachybotrys elegans]|uniref:Cytochrome P450 n=1 Tax=Stachybotrys elegans TaxID=80388 RepID=A0A8K0SZW4_9HYPO|nr:cytochrome P450 [Stachybotrys elegans]